MIELSPKLNGQESKARILLPDVIGNTIGEGNVKFSAFEKDGKITILIFPIMHEKKVLPHTLLYSIYKEARKADWRGGGFVNLKEAPPQVYGESEKIGPIPKEKSKEIQELVEAVFEEFSKQTANKPSQKP